MPTPTQLKERKARRKAKRLKERKEKREKHRAARKVREQLCAFIISYSLSLVNPRERRCVGVQ
jgi:hypothetical protein